MADEPPKQDIVSIEPAKWAWEGQDVRAGVIRPSEVWQFCAFIFAAALTLAYAERTT